MSAISAPIPSLSASVARLLPGPAIRHRPFATHRSQSPRQAGLSALRLRGIDRAAGRLEPFQGAVTPMIRRADLTPSRPQRICIHPMPTLVLPFPAINPVLVQWGPLAIRWYALAYIAGLLAGWLLIRRIVSNDRYWNGAKRPSADSIDDLLVYCAFGVIIGGRLGNVLIYDPRYYFPIQSRFSKSGKAAWPFTAA